MCSYGEGGSTELLSRFRPKLIPTSEQHGGTAVGGMGTLLTMLA